MAPSEPSAHHEAPTSPVRRVEPLSEIERKILDFMVQYLRANTYQPSIREIGERFGIKSTKTVSEHLQSLADKGFLERDPSRSRGVKILGVDLSAKTVSVPCYDSLPKDGVPLESRGADLHLSIDRRLAGEKGSFFLRAAPGDLAVLGVHEGDYILMEPVRRDEVEDGAVILARLEGRPSFHRVTSNGSGLHLESLNPGGEATVAPDSDSVKILGRVTAFYRRMDESAGPLNLTQH